MDMMADLSAQIPAYAQMEHNLLLLSLQGISYAAKVCIWTYDIIPWVMLACDLNNKS